VPDDGLSFRRGSARPAPPGSGRLIFGLLVTVLIAAGARPLWTAQPPKGVLVEVVGDVPRPGLHAVVDPTVARAVAAAGGDSTGVSEAPLGFGDRVEVGAEGARVLPPSDPLLIGLPIDLNTADATVIASIPEIGSGTADAIVAERSAGGPYRSLDDVGRAPGVGAMVLARLVPFVTVVDAGPLDLNTATAAQLERLPGVGPVLAARIVVNRAERGPFADLADLERVGGVGAALVASLHGAAAAVAP